MDDSETPSGMKGKDQPWRPGTPSGRSQWLENLVKARRRQLVPTKDQCIDFVDNLTMDDWIALWQAYSQVEYSVRAWRMAERFSQEGLKPLQVALAIRDSVVANEAQPLTSAAITKWFGGAKTWGDSPPEDPRGTRQFGQLKLRFAGLAFGSKPWWPAIIEEIDEALLQDCRLVRLVQFIEDHFLNETILGLQGSRSKNKRPLGGAFNRADLLCLDMLLEPFRVDLQSGSSGAPRQDHLVAAHQRLRGALCNQQRYPFWSNQINAMPPEKFYATTSVVVTYWTYPYLFALECFEKVKEIDSKLQ